MVVLSPSLLPVPTLHCFRHESGSTGSGMLSHKNSNYIRRFHEKITVCCSFDSKPTSQNVLCRRDLLLFALSSSLSAHFPSSGCLASEDVRTASFVDEINSYTYSYPVEQPSKKIFKWVESRKPERYSSAAPLSPDARLRIVSERVDFADNLIISVSIGPPNIQFLKSKDKKTWAAKDVADSVLSDKSALRVTSSQRMSESSVLDAHASEIDGELYWYYEYLVRKSPTKSAQEANLYRHYVASTAEREGYLYSLNASTLSKEWTEMGPFLEQTVASFRLLPPTDNYVPPYKDPWRFW
ncbi:PsbP domain-containing protein 5 [Hibiscus syriacus]|uniref:PsbP domain-containing protein 5 n=1 Tax=Hibiscus syriacus TaxID=106335 RepID=A0A6A3CEZ7_HIBSY|nr:psbP domain-containing protein 5, chloroplastic-like isoform X1 [Hibiscus syriacus]KAE8726251.1 PsbP domain-containing protein 5 [Hibiscus syriacus]